eukprot:4296174-Pleurochrysis_carterae.AAC.1
MSRPAPHASEGWREGRGRGLSGPWPARVAAVRRSPSPLRAHALAVARLRASRLFLPPSSPPSRPPPRRCGRRRLRLAASRRSHSRAPSLSSAPAAELPPAAFPAAPRSSPRRRSRAGPRGRAQRKLAGWLHPSTSASRSMLVALAMSAEVSS